MVQQSQAHKRVKFAAVAMTAVLALCATFTAVTSPYASADPNPNTETAKNAATAAIEENDLSLMPEAAEASLLVSSTEVDISPTVEAIEKKKEAARKAAAKKREEARKAAERKRKALEKKHIDRANSNIATWKAKVASDQGASALSNLSPVDWSVGKDQFISTWTNRINSYLAGSTLSGYGSTFAEAAWEYGIDPRWSPAISNTESTKGAHCFLPCNAWGWGHSSWATWDEAIWAHVAGLAAHYGYSITYSFAYKYCPPNYNNWFNETLGQMKRI